MKRLAASLILAARTNRQSARDARDALLAAVEAYRERMLVYTEMTTPITAST